MADNQHTQVKELCNTVLYVLTHSYYRGEDSHLVELSKQFIKELKKDVETRITDDSKKANEAVVAAETLPGSK
jgi:hypothetical protein